MKKTLYCLFKRIKNKLLFKLPKELEKPKNVSKYFILYQWKTYLAKLDFEDNKMRDAALKLNEFLNKFNELAKQFNLNFIKMFFSNYILELKPHETKEEFHLSLYRSFDHNCFVIQKNFIFNYFSH